MNVQFLKVSRHNLKRFSDLRFCMDFLKHGEGGMVFGVWFSMVFLLSPLQCTCSKFTGEIVRGCVSLKKYKSQGRAVEAEGCKEMSSNLADQKRPRIWAQMRARVGGGRVAGSQPMITAVHRRPNKLWRSKLIFILCVEVTVNSKEEYSQDFFLDFVKEFGLRKWNVSSSSDKIFSMQSLTLEDVAYLLDMDGEGLCLHGLYTGAKKIN